jgi:hypothetical protein
MSTRCQIGYYENLEATEIKALIYKHNDGYPADTLVSIAEFLKQFGAARGLDDDEYLMAQLLVFLVNKQNEGFTDRAYRFLGFGICGDRKLHGDIEYLYQISPDGVQVYDIYNEEALLTPEEAKAVLTGVVPVRFTED